MDLEKCLMIILNYKRNQKMSVKAELELIAKQNRGLINPKKVVEFAKDKKTALHKKFTWDDTKAAYEYRLYQARELIRVSVTVLDGGDTRVRAFVSLNQDRHGRGGYRSIRDVLSSEELRLMMVNEILEEYQRIEGKYNKYAELEPIYKAVRTVSKRVKRKKTA